MPTPNPNSWQTLSPYLDEALAMSDEERSRWLSTLRNQSPDLAKQLEMLLHEHQALSDEGFLEQGSIRVPQSSGLAGKTLGAYTLQSQIGQGGMGSVWLAERNDGRFERKVAVKFLNLALMGKAGEERFQREGVILGRLTDPHIAELIDAGVSESGQPYLILEHIEGDHIDRYCDQRRLDVAARVRLFLDVLQAVAEAHANSIVHRDLKPSNVLVRNDGQVKLLDFGIAKLLEDETPGTPQLTADGSRVMTPEYAAPEQLAGRAVTTATDVYALGVLLYVLLTGHHPAGVGPHTPLTLVKAVLETDPARPSDIVASSKVSAELAVSNAARRATTPGRLSRKLRGDLDTIVAKAVKKNPQQRYASVTALADDLQRYLRNEPISARPDTIVYRASKFVRRHRNSVAAALLVALALIAVTLTTWFISYRPKSLPQFNQRKLTANPEDLRVLSAAISPDGKYLGYADRQGIHLQLVETGAPQNVPLPPGVQSGTAYWEFGDWYPDSTRFIASVSIPGKPAGLWSFSVLSGNAEKLAEVEDMSGRARISPDGSNIAYARLRSAFGARELWLMGPHGESPHKIRTAENQSVLDGITWSPAGNRIAYVYTREGGDNRDISVQSCDLSGENKTTILRDYKLNAFAWVPAGRFIYSKSAAPGTAESDDLWELRVDDRNGTPQSRARRLTDWSGFSVNGFSATADGKRLAFLRGSYRVAVIVGDLADNGRRLFNPHQLTLDDNINIPMAWTPDSHDVIFSSKRAANRLIYKQALEPGSAPQLVTSAPGMDFYLARFTPDGAWLILEGRTSGAKQVALYRLGIKSGDLQLIFHPDGFIQFGCTNQPADLCVFGQTPAGKNELVVTSFDPLGTDMKAKERLRIPLEPGTSGAVGQDYSWQLSPDGSRIGIARRRGNQIRLVPLDGGPTRTVTIKGYSDLQDLFWSIDSQGLFVSTGGPGGATLLHVDLNGQAQPIWQQPQTTWTWGFPSPDGRHLAIVGDSSAANVWMISNF